MCSLERIAVSRRGRSIGGYTRRLCGQNSRRWQKARALPASSCGTDRGLPQSAFLREHPIDAEAAWPGGEDEQRAAEDCEVLQEIAVLRHHLRRRVFPLTMCQRGCTDEE